MVSSWKHPNRYSFTYPVLLATVIGAVKFVDQFLEFTERPSAEAPSFRAGRKRVDSRNVVLLRILCYTSFMNLTVLIKLQPHPDQA
jgi:hypothetical protein